MNSNTIIIIILIILILLLLGFWYLPANRVVYWNHTETVNPVPTPSPTVVNPPSYSYNNTTTVTTTTTCYVGGCSGQICSDQPGMASNCEFRPEYACYKNATCEVQANGQCGWTPTASLTQCLNSAH
jgi:hypothetical protein